MGQDRKVSCIRTIQSDHGGSSGLQVDKWSNHPVDIDVERLEDVSVAFSDASGGIRVSAVTFAK